MTHEISKQQSFCVAATTNVIGDKWTPKILLSLIQKPLHFCEIQELTDGINPRTLSSRLNKLVELGILDKSNDTRRIYSITNKGNDLVPILKAMINWGDKYKK